MSHPKRYFINTLQDYQGNGNPFTDPNWNSKIHQTVNVITDKQKPSVKAADGGLYVGIAGIGYMFYHMSLSPTFSDEKSKLLEKGLEYVEPALEFAERHQRDKSQTSAFLLGNAGIYAVAAALYHALGMSRLINLCTFHKSFILHKPRMWNMSYTCNINANTNMAICLQKFVTF
jgi:hypothetical protein